VSLAGASGSGVEEHAVNDANMEIARSDDVI